MSGYSKISFSNTGSGSVSITWSYASTDELQLVVQRDGGGSWTGTVASAVTAGWATLSDGTLTVDADTLFGGTSIAFTAIVWRETDVSSATLTLLSRAVEELREEDKQAVRVLYASGGLTAISEDASDRAGYVVGFGSGGDVLLKSVSTTASSTDSTSEDVSTLLTALRSAQDSLTTMKTELATAKSALESAKATVATATQASALLSALSDASSATTAAKEALVAASEKSGSVTVTIESGAEDSDALLAALRSSETTTKEAIKELLRVRRAEVIVSEMMEKFGHLWKKHMGPQWFYSLPGCEACHHDFPKHWAAETALALLYYGERVEACYDNLETITAVADNLTALTTIYNNIDAINTIYGSLTVLTELAANLDVLTTVATNIETILSLADNIDAIAGYASSAAESATAAAESATAAATSEANVTTMYTELVELYSKLSAYNYVVISREDYDALETKEEDVIYFVKGTFDIGETVYTLVNETIPELQESITGSSTSLSELVTSVETLTTSVEELSASVDGLSTSYESITESVTSMIESFQSQVSGFEDAYVLMPTGNTVSLEDSFRFYNSDFASTPYFTLGSIFKSNTDDDGTVTSITLYDNRWCSQYYYHKIAFTGAYGTDPIVYSFINNSSEQILRRCDFTDGMDVSTCYVGTSSSYSSGGGDDRAYAYGMVTTLAEWLGIDETEDEVALLTVTAYRRAAGSHDDDSNAHALNIYRWDSDSSAWVRFAQSTNAVVPTDADAGSAMTSWTFSYEGEGIPANETILVTFSLDSDEDEQVSCEMGVQADTTKTGGLSAEPEWSTEEQTEGEFQPALDATYCYVSNYETVSSLKAKIATLQSANTTLEERIAALEETVAALTASSDSDDTTSEE